MGITHHTSHTRSTHKGGTGSKQQEQGFSLIPAQEGAADTACSPYQNTVTTMTQLRARTDPTRSSIPSLACVRALVAALALPYTPYHHLPAPGACVPQEVVLAHPLCT